MKFGEELERQMVSEWHTQYLDYGLAKLKLQKLVRILSKLPSKKADMQENQLRDNASLHQARVLDDGGASDYLSPNERTPLVKRRSQSTSVLYRKSLQQSHIHHEEDIGNIARLRFLSWIDEQLNKVSAFHLQRQELYVVRFSILLDQLDQLEHAREFGGPDHHSIIHIPKKWIESPSLPIFFWSKNFSKPKQYYENGFVDKDAQFSNVAAPDIESAENMLKKAFYELYTTVNLLEAFKMLNTQAFRKIIKKYDKRTNDTVSLDYAIKVKDKIYIIPEFKDLSVDIEDKYTQHFCHGNRKLAMKQLKSTKSNRSYYSSSFFSGIFLGLTIPLIVKIAQHIWTWNLYYLQLWFSIFLVVLSGLLFSLNCWVFDRYKINYKLVFEMDPQTALNFRQYTMIFSLFLLLGCWLAYRGIQDNILFMPHFFLIGLTLLTVFPFHTLYAPSRLWFIDGLIRLLFSGFYPVLFKDFFFGVITCSLTYPISNLVMFVCTFQNKQCESSCGPSRSHLMGFLTALPPIWRVLQCFRRFAETGDWFPHFANMVKYTITTIYFMCLSIYRIYPSTISKSIFIFVSIINSSYSSIWDIFMDWSLCQVQSENFLLRDVLIYKSHWIYYCAAFMDTLMRFQWVLFVVGIPPVLSGLLVSAIELIRRFVWLLFRMENEHATNAYLFKVSRACKLPYPLHLFRDSSSEEILDAESENEYEQTDEDDDEAQNPQPFMGGSELESVYSSRSVRSTRSNWANLSKMISNAHIMEFQVKDKK